MVGYNPKFLGNGDPALEIPLPEFDASLEGGLVRNSRLRDGIWGDYIHYTVALSEEMRAPVVACLNVSQAQMGLTTRAKGEKSWSKDKKFGNEFQLGNEYYKDYGSAKNDYDKGHMAMRNNAAWGEDELAAIKASKDTFWYSNAALQHKNLNRDEWQSLEEWVGDLQHDVDDNITSFTGPVWSERNWSVIPPGGRPAIVPSAFFKIVCFVNKACELEVRAFMIVQHAEAIVSGMNNKVFDLETYQVSVTEIEEMTGLRFDPKISRTNPIMFALREDSTNPLNVGRTPERIEVSCADDMVAHGQVRETVADDDVDVFIAAAMVNAEGNERQEEWVSIINLEPSPVRLDGWALVDARGREHALSGRLVPGQAKTIKPLSPISLLNTGGSILLRGPDGARVDKVAWDAKTGGVEGRPVIFVYRGIY